MLSRLGRRIGAARGGVPGVGSLQLARPFTVGSRPVFEEKKEEKKANDFSDKTEFGIDRSNPEYAPFMGNHTWKEAAYPNMADHSWKGWEDLPAPYKYYEVKVNPADVENKGFFWDLMTNWKTAIPFTLGVAIPAFAYDVIAVDDHLELAAIFWTCIYLLKRHAGDAIWNMLDEEFKGIRQDMYKAEADYNDALRTNLDVHEKIQGVPEVVRAINEADRQLRHVEASAATRRAKVLERNRTAAMLDYLVAMESGDSKSAESRTFSLAAEAVLRRADEDKRLQQSLLKDSLDALQDGRARFPTLRSVLQEEVKHADENPPKADAEQAKREEKKARELFAKRFGFADTKVTEVMMNRARESREEMAILTARAGGKTPEVGMPLVQKMPIDYTK